MTVNTNIDRYAELGYVLIRGAVRREILERIRNSIDAGVDSFARKLFDEGKIADTYSGLPFDRQLAAIFEGQNPKMRSWDDVLPAAEIYDLVQEEGVKAPLEAVLGDQVVFSGDFHLRPKLPESKYTAFPWHQDSQYYGSATKNMHVVTVWTPLVDVDDSNGCLWAIPRSQEWGLLKGERGDDMNMRTEEDVEARGASLPVPMAAGDALLFSNLTFHASKLNQTDRLRVSRAVS